MWIISWSGVQQKLGMICSNHPEVEFAGIVLFSWEGKRVSIPLTYGMIQNWQGREYEAQDAIQRVRMECAVEGVTSLLYQPIDAPGIHELLQQQYGDIWFRAIPIRLREAVVGCVGYASSGREFLQEDTRLFKRVFELTHQLEDGISTISSCAWDLYQSSLTYYFREPRRTRKVNVAFLKPVTSFLEETISYGLSNRKVVPDPRGKELRQKAEGLLQYLQEVEKLSVE